MSLFVVTDFDKKVYEEQIKDFLPGKLIDMHTHVWRKEDAAAIEHPPEPKRTVAWPSLVAKDNSVEDLQQTYRLMFPDKEVLPLIFAGIGSESVLPAYNDYVSQSAKQTGFPALYYSHPKQSGEQIELHIKSGGFLGLKSYLDLAPTHIPEAEIEIYDFFPKHQLKVIDKLRGIFMLHVPRPARLKDPVNLAQILEIKQQFPNIKLIIAHIGRAYCKSDVGNAFEVLSQSADLLFDFCANTSEFVMTRMLESVGAERVLFGSDLPILRMRMRRIEEKNTYINLVPPGLYGDPTIDPHLREVSKQEGEKMTFFMYEEILAFKRAEAAVGLTKADVADVFHNNARKILDGAKASIYK